MAILKRWVHRLRTWRNYGDMLNRSVGIQNELFQMAAGKKPLPDREKCRELALKLGTLTHYWPKRWKS